ncbi:GNAT family N-acetyltransferase [Nitriliruptoraceae bacterium ZYF776]|nr:GNAT family N-acetyltransferase [Profundirhabdus halotolerans]
MGGGRLGPRRPHPPATGRSSTSPRGAVGGLPTLTPRTLSTRGTPLSAVVHVRHATVADAPALRRLIAVAGHEVDDLEVVERFRDLPEGNRVLVAEVGASVVGFAHVSLDPSLLVGWRAQLAGFAVATEHRGIGVEDRLLEAAEVWGREHGCSRLWVRSGSDRRAQNRVYRDHGFEDLDGQKAFSRPLGELDAPERPAPVRVVSTVPQV